MITLMIFSLGVGLFLAAVTVKFRDIQHLYSVFITALTYLTPVIYPMSILPSWLYKIVSLNPITNYLQMFRDLMLNNTMPSLLRVVVAIVEAGAMLVIGLYVFYKEQDEFILNI